jgi:AcrR family transcriptional regulator
MRRMSTKSRQGTEVMSEEGTKTKLLKAAISVFGSHGFVGGSVRQIADAAGTNIGAIKYHYGSKEGLWQEAVTHLFNELGAFIMRDAHLWPDMTPRERVANSTRNYIRFCASYPELNRIVLSETIENGHRMHWLAENHVRVFIERSAQWMSLAQESGVYPKGISILNLVFIAMSVSQYLYLMAPFVEHAFEIDVFEEAEIEKHVEAVITILFDKAGK